MKPQTLRALRALLSTAVLAVLSSTQALAADAPPKKSTPDASTTGPKSKAGLMTRDELRACMDEQDKLKEIRAQVLKEDAALNAQQAEIQKLDAEHAKRRDSLNPEDAAAKEALLGDVAKRVELASDYNTRSRALNEQSKALVDRRAAWLARCDKPFDEYDEAVIRKERQRAAGAAK